MYFDFDMVSGFYEKSTLSFWSLNKPLVHDLEFNPMGFLPFDNALINLSVNLLISQFLGGMNFFQNLRFYQLFIDGQQRKACPLQK